MRLLLSIAIPLILYLLLPILFMIKMWFNYTISLGKWLIESTLFGLYILDVFLTGVWPLTYGYLIRYGLIIVFIIVAAKSFFNIERTFYFTTLKIKVLLLNLVYLCIICFFAFRVILAFSGSMCPESSVEMNSPFKGKGFYVAHGGSNLIMNHHFSVSSQKYAMDIVKVNPYGFRAKRLFPNRLEDFFIYDTIVYSPCDGVIVDAMNEHEDSVPRKTNLSYPAGNYLVIRKENSEVIVVLAHLKKDLLVKKGETVRSSQPIAKVGNSGNTTEPHLHIHAVRYGESYQDFLFTGPGIPITFNKKFPIRNDKL